MSSFILIDFDTTSPQIEIYAPRYTTKDVVNEIVIQSNEPLSNYQEVYVIDSVGVRHDYTFQQEQDDQFVGLIRFNDFPFGIVTLYARLKDDVDNYSDLVYKTIEIKESSPSLIMKISDKQRIINETRIDRQVVTVDTSRKVESIEKIRVMKTNDRSRKIGSVIS